jgi:transposase-like protein
MTKIGFGGHCFSLEIIQQAIWLYVRFNLSFCGMDLLTE